MFPLEREIIWLKIEHLALILNATKFKNQRANKEEFIILNKPFQSF